MSTMLNKRPLIYVSLAASLLFAVIAGAVMYQLTSGADSAILLWLNSFQGPALDALVVVVTQLGGVLFVSLASLAVCAALAYRKQYKKLGFVIGSMGGMIILNLVLKAIFDRPRPDLWEWIVTETSLSFPSGHATASMALALVVLVLCWRTQARGWIICLGVAYVVLVGVSRLYLGVHYPTDIIGGWLLATAWVSCVAAVILATAAKPKKESVS